MKYRFNPIIHRVTKKYQSIHFNGQILELGQVVEISTEQESWVGIKRLIDTKQFVPIETKKVPEAKKASTRARKAKAESTVED